MVYNNSEYLDAKQFESLITSHYQYLKRMAFSLTRDHDDANDLIQDMMFRALKNRDKFKRDTNIKAWLYTVMRNIFYSSFKSNKNKTQSSNAVDVYENDSYINDSVKNLSKTNLMMEDINTIFAKMPQKVTTPFMMYVNGYKYEEISKELDIPLGTVKVHIYNCRELAKKYLLASDIKYSSDLL
jgi:RNA polymerase sigma-70 factor, ECF subfamily